MTVNLIAGRLSKILAIIIIVFLGTVFVFQFTNAALVPCGLSAGTAAERAPCTVCDIFKLISNVINFFFFTFTPSVATLLYLWAGFWILLGGTDPGKVTTGRTIMKNTTYGLLIIFSAWMITNTVLKSIAGDQLFAQDWNKVVCNNPVTPSGTPAQNQKYTCNSANQCIVKSDGEYTTSNCDGVCKSQVGTDKIMINTGYLADIIVNDKYDQTISVSGGKGPYAFIISQGNLPGGLEIDSTTGVISGTPDTEGSFTFTVEVSDSTDPALTTTKEFNIKVVPLSASVIISDIAVKDITENGATITWTTDKPADSQVEFGKSSSYGSLTILDKDAATGHQVTLDNLSPGSTYYFRAKSSIAGFNAVSSAETFKTTGSAPTSNVIISGVAVSDITDTGATITWTTDKPSTSQVEYGKSSSFGSLTTLDNTNNTDHSVDITGLTPGTSYSFRAKSSIAGFNAVSSTSTFKTTGTAPAGQTACLFTGINLCQGAPVNYSGGSIKDIGSLNCNPSGCSQYDAAINAAASQTGVSAKLLKANMVIESACQIGASSSDSGGGSFGLMQIQAGTANSFSQSCGIQQTSSACTNAGGSWDAANNKCLVTPTWLTNPANATASICIAAYYMKSLSQGVCGSSDRNILAGLSGGVTACQASANCSTDKSCDGTAVRKWECLYDDDAHSVCNGGSNLSGYNVTKYAAVKKLYCAGQVTLGSGSTTPTPTPVSEACSQSFGSRATGCSDINTCVDVSSYTPTHGCESNGGVCLLSSAAAAKAQLLISTFNNLAGGQCTLKINSALQVNGGSSVSTCHKPGNSQSGTCSDINILPNHDNCYKFFYQAAKQANVQSFLDEYVTACVAGSTTGGNIHVNF